MKTIIFTLLIAVLFASSGDCGLPSMVYINKGIKKSKNRDFDGAIADYNEVIRVVDKEPNSTSFKCKKWAENKLSLLKQNENR